MRGVIRIDSPVERDEHQRPGTEPSRRLRGLARLHSTRGTASREGCRPPVGKHARPDRTDLQPGLGLDLTDQAVRLRAPEPHLEHRVSAAWLRRRLAHDVLRRRGSRDSVIKASEGTLRRHHALGQTCDHRTHSSRRLGARDGKEQALTRTPGLLVARRSFRNVDAVHLADALGDGLPPLGFRTPLELQLRLAAIRHPTGDGTLGTTRLFTRKPTHGCSVASGDLALLSRRSSRLMRSETGSPRPFDRRYRLTDHRFAATRLPQSAIRLGLSGDFLRGRRWTRRFRGLGRYARRAHHRPRRIA